MMKKLLQQVFMGLTKKDLENLTTEVKETVFVDPDAPENEKRFTSAELWKIQQRKKPVRIRKGFNM